MILRSQLRMNKNIVFPFISCVMIMFTLLVLIHKSADELNAAKKELIHCKQQHDTMYTQLQNAVELKLHLEKTLENEKVDGRQKLDDVQALLNEEREKRQKEKEDSESKFVNLNQECSVIKSENKENTETVDTLNKKVLDLEEQLSKTKEQLKSIHSENEHKDTIINDLKEKLKNTANSPVQENKSIQVNNTSPPGAAGRINLAAVQSSYKGPITPEINPMAINREEESSKQVAPPPNGDESAQQKDLRKKLNAEGDTELKHNLENVEKAPPIQGEEEKNAEHQVDGQQIPVAPNGDKYQPDMFLLPPFNNKQASSVSNNAIENRDAFPAPVPQLRNEKEKNEVLPKEMKDFGAAVDYENNVGDEGEDYDNDSRLANKNKKNVQGNEVSN